MIWELKYCGKLEICHFYFLYRVKAIINRVLPTKEIVLVVHITLLHPSERIAKIRWNEHDNLTKRNNTDHYFTWTIISNSPKDA